MSRALHIFVAGLLIFAAACTGDSESATTETSSPSDASATPTTAVTTAAPDEPASDTAADRSAELLGRWEITHYGLPDGAFTNVVGDAPVFIEFNSDGSVEYNTGCNSGGTQFVTSGAYRVPESALDDEPEGQPITLGPVFEQTEIGCEGFLGDQDRDLPDNMSKTTRFVLRGDQLLLVGEFLLVDATRSN